MLSGGTGVGGGHLPGPMRGSWLPGWGAEAEDEAATNTTVGTGPFSPLRTEGGPAVEASLLECQFSSRKEEAGWLPTSTRTCPAVSWRTEGHAPVITILRTFHQLLDPPCNLS